jgi:SAM-dependent methyltransferase
MFIERRCCPVCRSGGVDQVYSEPYVGAGPETVLRPKHDRLARPLGYEERLDGFDYTILACRDCRALFQKLAPDPAFAAEYYGTWIARHDRPDYPLAEYTHHIHQAMVLTDFLLKATGKRIPDELSILDYGVGRGIFAAAMKACGCRVSGYDLSAERMSMIQQEGIEPVGYSDIPGSNFDFINTEQVFEHLPDPLATASHLIDGLSRRGIMKVSVPYAPWLEQGEVAIDWHADRYARNSSMPLQPIEHLTYFRRPSLTSMMRRLGFHIVRPAILSELNYTFDWGGLRKIGRNLLRPFLRNRLRNYYLFARTSPPGTLA